MSFIRVKDVVEAVAGVGLATIMIPGVNDMVSEKGSVTSVLMLDSMDSPLGRAALHWADGLWIAAAIYVGFSLRQPDRSVTIKHLKAVGLYGIPAFCGRFGVGPSTAFWAGLGWIAHPIWDLLHHDRVLGHANDDDDKPSAYVPHWYPMLCAGFDIALGGWLLNLARTGRA